MFIKHWNATNEVKLLISEKKFRFTLASFDAMKGLGMPMIMLIHTLAHLNWQGSAVLRFLKAMTIYLGVGGMAIFFMISGWGFKPKAAGKVLKQTFSNLIVPYLLVMLAYGILVPFTYYPVYSSLKDSAAFAARYVVAFLCGFGPDNTTIFGYETMWCTAAWFFLTLFIALNVLNLILKLKNNAVQIGCTLLCVITGIIMYQKDFFFFCLPQGLTAVGFCYGGYVFKKYDIIRRIYRKAWVYLVLIPVYLAEAKWGYFDMCQGVFQNIVLDFIGVGIGGLLHILLIANLQNVDWKILDWLSGIGIHSYWILAIHSVEMEVIPWYYIWKFALPEHPVLALICEGILKAMILTAGCYLLKRIARHRYQRKRK